MKILVVCHRFPFPPQDGSRIRPFNVIKHLSVDHQVTVVSLVRSPQEAEEARGIGPHCARFETAAVRPSVQMARMVARLPTLTPSTMGFFYSPELATRIRRLLATERFDLIFVHCSSVAQYVLWVRTVPKILDFMDMDSQKWLDYARFKPFPISTGYRLEGLKLMREERRLARMFDTCTTITHAEWEALEAYGTQTDADWFPNGVDTQYFSPIADDYVPDALCFVGRMDYYPNEECMRDFCTNTLPLVRGRRPHVTLTIVGADPSPGVKRLAAMPGVTVTGTVGDVRPHLRRSALMVAPLNIARGTQNKILEAMALGVPVVASRTAADGVDAEDHHHFLVAGTHQQQADAVLRILENPSERSRLAAAGRARMLSHHEWHASMLRMDRIIDRCLSRRAGAQADRSGRT